MRIFLELFCIIDRFPGVHIHHRGDILHVFEDRATTFRATIHVSLIKLIQGHFYCLITTYLIFIFETIALMSSIQIDSPMVEYTEKTIKITSNCTICRKDLTCFLGMSNMITPRMKNLVTTLQAQVNFFFKYPAPSVLTMTFDCVPRSGKFTPVTPSLQRNIILPTVSL